MELLQISILNPPGGLAWAPAAAAALSWLMIAAISTLRHAVHSISGSEARIMHRHRNPKEQRIYKLFQRKEKVKASLSTAETMLSLIFAISLASLVEGCQIFPGTELIAIEEPVWPSCAALFVALCFAITIAEVLPGRMMGAKARHAMLIKAGWIAEAVSAAAAPATFCDSYSGSAEQEEGSTLTVSIGSDPPQTGEKDMIRNILQFGDIEVREIMTPRHGIVAVDATDSFSALKAKIRDSNFSRIPVYEKSTDNIFGIIYVKDLIAHISEGDGFCWGRLVRRIKFVPENKKISDLLREFQKTKNHMAAVSDEYGGISGLITMQDILEKIVGEISDEFDVDDQASLVAKMGEGHYICDGRVMLDDFCRELGLESGYFDTVKGDAESLAGVLLEIRGEFPQVHEKIQCRELTMAVESFSGRRIEKISVRL